MLSKPQSRPGIGHLIDRHWFWRVPDPPAALVGWLRRHPPAGTRLSTWGSGGDRGVASLRMRGYSYRTLPQGIYEAELDFAIAAAKGGGSAVRVDSFAAGLVPRPAWEHVPASVAKVAISVRRYDDRRSYSVATQQLRRRRSRGVRNRESGCLTRRHRAEPASRRLRDRSSRRAPRPVSSR